MLLSLLYTSVFVVFRRWFSNSKHTQQQPNESAAFIAVFYFVVGSIDVDIYSGFKRYQQQY